MTLRRSLTRAALGLALSAGLMAAPACDSDADDGGGVDTSAADTSIGVDTSASDTSAADTSAADTSEPPLVPTVTTTSYETAEQMLLANEINESGEPFAEALGYDLELLDPMVPDEPDAAAYVLGIENYEYSRYQLGTVISRSGLGLHMMWAPKVMAQAAMMPADFDGTMTGGMVNGFKEDDMLMKMIGGFSAMSGQPAPGNPWPQFAEFAGGDPHLPQAVDASSFAWADFSTLRWDRSKMDKALVPAALGQALMKQYLWAQDMLSAYHNGADEGIEPSASVSPDRDGSPDFDPDNDVFFGGNSLDGFVGMVLTAEAINKVAFLTGRVIYDGAALGAVDLMTYDPADGLRYFPHRVAITEAPVAAGLPPKVDTLTVDDASSQLFDQASLLWGTSSFTGMMAPDDDSDAAHLAYHQVFDGSPFPPAMSESGSPGPYDLMKGTSKLIVMNLMAMHKDPTAKVLVDSVTVSAGAATRGDTVSAVESAYIIVALESFIGPFAGTPLEQAARELIADQAAFMVAHLSDGAGLYADSVTIGAGAPTTPGSVSAQAAAVRGLFVAARVTGDASLASAASLAQGKLMSDYYSAADGLFADSPGGSAATFTPHSFALIAGALREASLEGSDVYAAETYIRLFRLVGGAMQLSEGAASGETGGDSDGDGIPFIPEQAEGLPPIFASQAVFELSR